MLIRLLSYFGNNLENTSLGNIINSEIEKANNSPKQACKIYESLFKKIIDIYPDATKGIQEFVDDNLADAMSKFAIKNYTYGGNADGYSVKGGKMSPKEFAITTFITPIEIGARSQAQNKEIDENQELKRNSEINILEGESDYDKMQKKIKSLENDFKKVSEISLRPEMIEMVYISKNNQIMVATIDGEKRPVGYPLASKGDNGNIYYNFNGNVDDDLKSKIYFKLEKIEPEEKAKITEDFKKNGSKIYEDTIEDDAMYWYGNQIFESESEEDKEILRKKELESHGKFLLSTTKDGKAIINILDNGISIEEHTGEIIYSKDGKGKYNKFFEQIRGEWLQKVDELGKQVIPEMKDVQSQDSLEEIINTQAREKDSSERETK